MVRVTAPGGQEEIPPFPYIKYPCLLSWLNTLPLSISSPIWRRKTDVSCNYRLSGWLPLKMIKGEYLQGEIVSASGTPVFCVICIVTCWFPSPLTFVKGNRCYCFGLVWILLRVLVAAMQDSTTLICQLSSNQSFLLSWGVWSLYKSCMVQKWVSIM